MIRIGIHLSSSGGMLSIAARAKELRCKAIQIFTSNQRQWAGRKLDPVEEGAAASLGIPVFSHASYLINLASSRPDVVRLSEMAIRQELERSGFLGIHWIVLHPGSHLGRGVRAGLSSAAKRLRSALMDCPGEVGVLLENSAGQGTGICSRLEDLAGMLDLVGLPRRTGVCFDTAHAFAAGYDLSSVPAMEHAAGLLDRAVGLERVLALHLNDSRSDLGSKSDRHEEVGCGLIGVGPLAALCRLPRLQHAVGIVETPGTDRDRLRDARRIRRRA
ncbi:deoxyribonuclease IV [Candidatus Fermentibacterales bacterium]|nr:deoxyribonuclease IV [Candidatus Fermentibacterales bacterium]